MQHLDGHGASQQQVGRLIDGASSALTQTANQPVTPLVDLHVPHAQPEIDNVMVPLSRVGRAHPAVAISHRSAGGWTSGRAHGCHLHFCTSSVRPVDLIATLCYGVPRPASRARTIASARSATCSLL